MDDHRSNSNWAEERQSRRELTTAAHAYSASVYLREAIEFLQAAVNDNASEHPVAVSAGQRHLRLTGSATPVTAVAGAGGQALNLRQVPDASLNQAAITKLELALGALGSILHD